MSSELIKCPACLGFREILGLGLIVKKCSNCDGIGKIIKVIEVLSSDYQPSVKRGRKPKSYAGNSEG